MVKSGTDFDTGSAISLEKTNMYNVFYIIGVIVVVLAILSLIGLT